VLHPGGILTWAKVGSESVQAKINGNENDCVIVLASASAARENILAFVASGKNKAGGEPQIGPVQGHWRDHSESGWQKSEKFQTYLSKLRMFIGERPISSPLGFCVFNGLFPPKYRMDQKISHSTQYQGVLKIPSVSETFQCKWGRLLKGHHLIIVVQYNPSIIWTELISLTSH
jgi:hypothetical protein